MLPPMKVLVVLPTYNEAANVDRVLRRIRHAVASATILIVDDGSPDGTADIAETVGKELGNIEVMRRHAKSGLGSAYRAGFRWGLSKEYDAFVEMDADLSHDPEALPGCWSPWPTGMTLVIGSRYVPGGAIPDWTWHRRLLSKGGNVYASALLGLGVSDSTAGFRAYSATVLDRIDLDRIRAEGYGFQIEMTYQAKRAGASLIEVPIRFVDRVDGESKMSMFIVIEALGLVTLWGAQRLVERHCSDACRSPSDPSRRAHRGGRPLMLATTDQGGSGPPVVLLHGQPGTGASWDPLSRLLEGDFRVLAPDRIGYGATPGEAQGLAANADLVAELIHDRHLGPATLVAHSWAGGVAVLLCGPLPRRW